MNEYSRIQILLQDKLNIVKNLEVLIIGLGGVGSYVVESLARMGVKKLILVDYDTVDITNINRQLEAVHSTIGRYKADVLKERILDINPNCEVILIKEKITISNIELLYKYKVDFLVDACDDVIIKKEILKLSTLYNQKFIMSMGTANKLDPTKLKIMDLKNTSYDPLAKILRKEARRLNIKAKIPVVSSTESPKVNSKTLGSVSFVPSSAGLLITSYIINETIK